MKSHLIKPLIAIIALMLADQTSKQAIVIMFDYGQGVTMNAFLNIVRVHNYGAAFSFLSDAGGWQHYFFTVLGVVASAFMAVWAWRSPKEPRLVWALTLIIAGALGNVIDRLRFGYVVDFVDVHWGTMHWPAFNVADSSICIGAALLIADEIIKARAVKAAKQKS